jgi:hypothetical protein
VRIGRIEPERLLDQLAHRRHETVAGEVQPVGKPAFLGEEAHESSSKFRVLAGFENHRAIQETIDDHRLAIETVWPVDGR